MRREDDQVSPLPGTFYRRPDPTPIRSWPRATTVKPRRCRRARRDHEELSRGKSDASGVVEHFLVENEDTVEAGQDLAGPQRLGGRRCDAS